MWKTHFNLKFSSILMIDRKGILLPSTVKPLNVSNSWPCNQTLKTPHLLRLRKKMQNAWGHFSPKLHNDGGCVCWRFSWTLGLITVQCPQLPQWQKKNMLFPTTTILQGFLIFFSFLKTQPNKELQEPFVCNINTRLIPMVHANIIFQGYIQSMP